MTLGESLRRYRKQRNFVQKELAAKIGISLKHYGQIERGKTFPSHEILQRICDVVPICVDYRIDMKSRRAPDKNHLR